MIYVTKKYIEVQLEKAGKRALNVNPDINH